VRELTRLGIEIETFDAENIKQLGMRALLGVGQGSMHPPILMVLRWNGGKKNAPPIAFVGKGVTFDSGGLSLKPVKSLELMKWDMAGAAAVVGALMALAGRDAKVNAVGIIALVENMPSGTAQRPGDVVRSMSGQTIEVLNTDFEGRLVLADALWYCQERIKPAVMIDLATLTGVVIAALGREYGGLFSNNDDLADALIRAGKSADEAVWRLPLGDSYDKKINSDIADVKNTGDGDAGSVIGAQFLKRFVNDVPWAHIDIGGVAWSFDDHPNVPKGATGWGVRLLDQLVRQNWESGN
jgi:leucyl aminopeptidase